MSGGANGRWVVKIGSTGDRSLVVFEGWVGMRSSWFEI